MIELRQETLVGRDIYLAKQLLSSEKLVAIPTETVYGLAANMFSESAVKKIFEVKKRPATNPLIVHVSNKESLKAVISGMPDAADILLDKFAPGPITLLLPKSKSVSDLVTSGLPNVAIRIPDHQLTLELLNKLDFPLVAPSANPYTYISPTSAEHVKTMLNGMIPYILDGGASDRGLESTIIGFPAGVPTVYRMGAISIEEIETVIGKVKLAIAEKAIAPGMHLKHYSPRTKLIVSDDIHSDIIKYSKQKIGLMTYNQYSEHLPHEDQIILCKNNDFKTAGKNLYAAMHSMDNKSYDIIIAHKFPDTGIGHSINDRLNRAKA